MYTHGLDLTGFVVNYLKLIKEYQELLDELPRDPFTIFGKLQCIYTGRQQ
jgi:Txe/YoeB family toxin of Txe-Axe toxin-antitoxin module